VPQNSNCYGRWRGRDNFSFAGSQRRKKSKKGCHTEAVLLCGRALECNPATLLDGRLLYRIHLPLETRKLSRVLIIAFGEQQRRPKND
jgi:hypothetical protein